MTAPAGPLVAIGVGSVLRSDDAIGVRVIEGLRALAGHDPDLLPAGTELVDGGTLGLDLLRVVHGSRGVVLVDGVRLGGAAGTVSVLRGDEIDEAVGTRDGGAAGAVGELLAVARLMDWLPEPVTLVGVEVADIGVGTDLTPVVDGALPTAMGTVRHELRRMDGLPQTGMSGGSATARMAGTTA